MSDEPEMKTGTIVWRDLTVPDAEAIRDFYSAVTGWTSSPQDMGGYDDYNMISAADGQVVAGICHARGSNANLPSQWLVYVAVESMDQSIKRCIESGGQVIDGPRSMGEMRFCVIQDPAGAVMGLIGP